MDTAAAGTGLSTAVRDLAGNVPADTYTSRSPRRAVAAEEVVAKPAWTP